MSSSLLALTLYAGWILTLVVLIIAWRTVLTVSGRHPANRFLVDGTDLSPLAARLSRAHANGYENAPIAASLLVAAELSGHAAITDPLALWLVAARVAQSTVHLISTSVPAVIVRYCLFVAQLAIEGWWFAQLVSVGLA